MTPDEAALGFSKSTLATHAEARITRELHPLAVPGDKLVVEGEYPPCNSCKGKMNGFKGATDADVEYKWASSDRKSVEAWSAKARIVKNYLGLVVAKRVNMKKFFASTIKFYEEDEVLVIALGDDPVAPSNFMIITRLDDEDNATVNDGIGFQTDQAEYEMHDAIEKVILRPDSLEVVVKSEFAGFFGGLSILAEIPQESHDSSGKVCMLKDALQNIFSGAQVELVV